MDLEDKQEHLLKIITHVLKFYDIKGLRAVEGYWSDDLNTLHLNYYHHGPLNDYLRDIFNDLGGEILSHYHSEMLQDQPIRLDYDIELPNSSCLVFPEKNLK